MLLWHQKKQKKEQKNRVSWDKKSGVYGQVEIGNTEFLISRVQYFKKSFSTTCMQTNLELRKL